MFRSIRTPALVLAGLLVAGLAGVGCKMGDKSSEMSDKSLFDRLGGHAAVVKVVDEFVPIAAADPKVNFFRKGHPNEWKPNDAQVATFKTRLVEFVEQATGGPQAYKGKDMATAHAGMEITSAEFDAIGADLKAALDKLKVGEKEQGELLAIVGTTKVQMVGK